MPYFTTRLPPARAEHVQFIVFACRFSRAKQERPAEFLQPGFVLTISRAYSCPAVLRCMLRDRRQLRPEKPPDAIFERQSDWRTLTTMELLDQSSRRKFIKAGGIVIASSMITSARTLLAKEDEKKNN
jgi:hypothetical protein